MDADNTINFAIPGAGVQTINLTTNLPTITKTVTIDGFTQQGAVFGSPLIELNASDAIIGLELVDVNGCRIRGLRDQPGRRRHGIG